MKCAHTVSVKTCMAARARALRGYLTYDVCTKHCRMLGVQNVPVRTKHIGIICMKSASSGYVKIINWPRVLEDSIVKVV